MSAINSFNTAYIITRYPPFAGSASPRPPRRPWWERLLDWLSGR